MAVLQMAKQMVGPKILQVVLNWARANTTCLTMSSHAPSSRAPHAPAVWPCLAMHPAVWQCLAMHPTGLPSGLQVLGVRKCTHAQGPIQLESLGLWLQPLNAAFFTIYLGLLTRVRCILDF